MAALSVRVSRARYLRRRAAERGLNRGRLRRMRRWCDARAADAVDGGIGDTGTPVAVTADNATDTFTEAAHGFNDGAGGMIIGGTAVPAGLDGERPYFMIATTAGTFQLARSRPEALQQRSAEPFTDDGTAVTREPGANYWSFFALMQAGKHPLEIQAATDIDSLIFT